MCLTKDATSTITNPNSFSRDLFAFLDLLSPVYLYSPPPPPISRNKAISFSLHTKAP